jgi:hypothetical protein
MRMFENRVLKMELTGDRRELHTEELLDLYFSSDIIGVVK